MKPKTIIVIQIVVVLLFVGKSEAASLKPDSKNLNRVFALGLGIDMGIVGIKYEQWLKDKPIIVGAGMGVEAIIRHPIYFPLKNKLHSDTPML